MPVIPYDPPYNWDLLSSVDNTGYNLVLETHKPTLSEPYLLHAEDSDPALIQENLDEAEWVSDYLTSDEDPMEPISDYYYPIIDNGIDQLDLLDETNYDKELNKVVGLLSVSVYWRDALKNILPESSKGIVVVIDNECNLSFTYQLDGGKIQYLGGGDHHDFEYEDLVVGSWLHELKDLGLADEIYSGRPLNEEHCPFYIRVYPSDINKASFTSQDPVYFAVCAMLIFVLTSLGFVLYATCVERRHRKIQRAAATSKRVVDSLFPEFVRDGVEEEIVVPLKPIPAEGSGHTLSSSFQSSFQGSISDSDSGGSRIRGKPLADLFPNTTVFFADISGFTAWSSFRNPTQVFTLLENLYGAFDAVAHKRRVFKIETIGDCYVAVTGLPKPQDDHAVRMTLFAKDCREKMKQVIHDLEIMLGPGTADLRLRIGLHSGPTTAGVLRGKKARFQLFGDTVNTASRMESTGIPNLIHVSQKTADLLIGNGKGHWVRPRSDLIHAKGKGMLQTYFVEPSSRRQSGDSYGASSTDSPPTSTDDAASSQEVDADDRSKESKREATLIDWNTQLFEGLLKDVVIYRRNKMQEELSRLQDKMPLPQGRAEAKFDLQQMQFNKELAEMEKTYQSAGDHKVSVDDDVNIKLPRFQPHLMMTGNHIEGLSPECREQLHDYICKISSMHQTLPFHNFEHASHATVSVIKLLQQIATKEATTNHSQRNGLKHQGRDDYTTLILDPLTKFALAFSMLIHDMKHLEEGGEGQPHASVQAAWTLLMKDSYADLRRTIYATPAELDRFRHLVLKCVQATHITNDQFTTAREDRWARAFPSSLAIVGDNGTTKDDRSEVSSCGSSSMLDMEVEVDSNNVDSEDDVIDETWNSKALVVIEYIIQASDWAHCMQHWHVYQKWTSQLFPEDRSGGQGFFDDQLKFLDNHIIPLTRKLKQCEVFGFSCDSFLEFAIENRSEWMRNGPNLVRRWEWENEE